MAPQELERRDLSELAFICRDLFDKYAAATLDPACSALIRQSAARQQERFSTSDLAVFTRSNTSLDCEEIRALAIEQLVVIRTNLEFAALHDTEFPGKSDVLSSPKDAQRREWIQQLEGTPSEALEAVEATIDRLDELGEVVRQHPALNQGTQVEDATDRDGEGSGLLWIKRAVQSNSPTAPLRLQNHLIASAFERRNSLRQLKQRQPTRVQQPTDRGGTPAPTELPGRGSNSPESQSSRQSRSDMCLDTPQPRSSFDSTPGSSRLRLGGSSIALSSQSRKTTLAEDDRVDYPEPPKAEHGKPAPQCPYCCEVLESSDLSQPAWKCHVNKDLKPYICLFDNCIQASSLLQNEEIWANHMEKSHGKNWPRKLGNSLDKRQATGTQSSSAKTRAELVCPLCDSWSLTKGGTLPDEYWKESYKLGRLAQHVANHLLRLAFESSGKLEENTHQTSPSSSSEEIDTNSGQDAPSLSPENPSNGESESIVGSDRSFGQHEPKVSQAINMPENYGSIAANERRECSDVPTDTPDATRKSVSERELGTAVKVINRPNEAFPFPTMENRVDWKQVHSSAGVNVPFQQKSPNDEAIGIDNALDRNSNPPTLSSMRTVESCNDYAGAETTHQQMIHPSSQLSSSEHPQSLSSMVEIAKGFFHRRKYQEAEEEYRKALKLHAKVMEANDPGIISIKGNLANALAKQGKHHEAEGLYEEMSALSAETLGEKHPHTLSCRSNLASCLEKRGEYTKAEEIYRNVWELQRTTLGDNHRDTLSSNNKLANALMRLKEFDKAMVIYKETLETRSNMLGEEHPHTIITLGNLANSLQNQGQFEEAKAKYLEALKVGTKVLDHEHPHLHWIRIRCEEALKDEGE